MIVANFVNSNGSMKLRSSTTWPEPASIGAGMGALMCPYCNMFEGRVSTSLSQNMHIQKENIAANKNLYHLIKSK